MKKQSTFAQAVAANTRSRREKRRWTRQELAERLGVDSRIVRMLESGEHPQAAGQHLDGLAKVFGVTPASMVRLTR